MVISSIVTFIDSIIKITKGIYHPKNHRVKSIHSFPAVAGSPGTHIFVMLELRILSVVFFPFCFPFIFECSCSFHFCAELCCTVCGSLGFLQKGQTVFS